MFLQMSTHFMALNKCTISKSLLHIKIRQIATKTCSLSATKATTMSVNKGDGRETHTQTCKVTFIEVTIVVILGLCRYVGAEV